MTIEYRPYTTDLSCTNESGGTGPNLCTRDFPNNYPHRKASYSCACGTGFNAATWGATADAKCEAVPAYTGLSELGEDCPYDTSGGTIRGGYNQGAHTEQECKAFCKQYKDSHGVNSYVFQDDGTGHCYCKDIVISLIFENCFYYRGMIQSAFIKSIIKL